MELQCVERYFGKRSANLFRWRIDKQPDDFHQRRQRADYFARTIEIDVARRSAPQHDADGVGARLRRGETVLHSGDTADFDACAHGLMYPHAATRGGVIRAL